MATYGIDLGTTYSCISYVDESGRPVVLKSEVGDDLTPSVVYFESPDSVVVGRSAKNTALLHPELVVSLIKRQMGQQVESPYHNQTHTPETISALILRELARAAEQQTGQPVRDVVISVPAYFGVGEREATRKAGEIAGLRVLNLVPEPVAAALHYEALSGGGDRTVLVYDLGGGTFDTTVIRLAGNDIRVLCTDGDHHLGGADWDEKLVDHLVDEFRTAHPDKDPAADEEFLQGLSIDAEQLKKDLSSVQSRRPAVRFDGSAVQVEVSQEKFEELTSELFERTMEITQRTIETARERGVERFDDVLLVGGASRMPVVGRELRARFGFEPRLHDPDLAVAKGAAQFALIESLKVSLPGETATEDRINELAVQLGLDSERVGQLVDKTITTVVPRAFGVKVVDSRNHDRLYVDHLLHANDALPASAQQRYFTIEDRQTAIKVEIHEQVGAAASPELEHNASIGEGMISELPPLAKGSPIDVSFAMDELGNLRVHAVELSTSKDVHIELQIGGLDPRQVEEARSAIGKYTVSA
jgi:molecular chaperone DnaK